MKAHVKTRDGRIVFEVESESQKELFEKLAIVQEVFDCASECGMCHSKAIRYQVRAVKDNKYYELACNECSARFQFGQTKKDNRLFPKRRDEETKRLLPNQGWSKWEGKGSSEEAY